MPLSNISDVEYASIYNSYHQETLRNLKDGVFNLWREMNKQKKFASDSGTQYYNVMGSNSGVDQVISGVFNTIGTFIDVAFATGLIEEGKEAMGSRVAQNTGFPV